MNKPDIQVVELLMKVVAIVSISLLIYGLLVDWRDRFSLVLLLLLLLLNVITGWFIGRFRKDENVFIQRNPREKCTELDLWFYWPLYVGVIVFFVGGLLRAR